MSKNNKYLTYHTGKIWYNIREHNEPSGCGADIWRMCANHDEAKQNHGIICANTMSQAAAEQTFGECARTMMKRSKIMV